MAREREIVGKAHKAGQSAYKRGKPISACPHDDKAKKDSDEWLRHENWRNGWQHARFTKTKKR
jgi:hypothetical protein